MWHEPDATGFSTGRLSHPVGLFDPYYRPGVQRRTVVALCLLPALLAVLLYAVSSFSRMGAIACSIVLAGLALLAIREVFGWWYWTYCSHCGCKVAGPWCAGCDRLSAATLRGAGRYI